MDKLLFQEKDKRKVLNWDEYKEIASQVHTTQEKALNIMSEFLNDVGSIIWINKPGVRDLVILDDNWLSKVFASIVNFSSSWKNGIVSHVHNFLMFF